ncbi:hypothetical protein L596_021620 [Steinernema carpocapsae]|uniref:Uncharacterized protein n=1 Tax=Steinernema carpocapsae TaxID=34508 RepID=A0A4U5MJ97_STECR|nr:hypothetical protein L596_021620 [Steinernema carpocapsae]
MSCSITREFEPKLVETTNPTVIKQLLATPFRHLVYIIFATYPPTGLFTHYTTRDKKSHDLVTRWSVPVCGTRLLESDDFQVDKADRTRSMYFKNTFT